MPRGTQGMDSELIQLIARLKIRLRQDQGISLNTQRFFEDREYALEALDRAEESEDIEVVSAALALRDRLGWLAPQPVLAVAPQPAAPPPADPMSGRYKFGARGG